MNAEDAWNLVDMIQAYLKRQDDEYAQKLAEKCEEILTWLEKPEKLP